MVKEADRYLAELKSAVDYYGSKPMKSITDFAIYEKALNMYECAKKMKEIMERGN